MNVGVSLTKTWFKLGLGLGLRLFLGDFPEILSRCYHYGVQRMTEDGLRGCSPYIVEVTSGLTSFSVPHQNLAAF